MEGNLTHIIPGGLNSGEKYTIGVLFKLLNQFLSLGLSDKLL